jgi:hypothetical protein
VKGDFSHRSTDDAFRPTFTTRPDRPLPHDLQKKEVCYFDRARKFLPDGLTLASRLHFAVSKFPTLSRRAA